MGSLFIAKIYVLLTLYVCDGIDGWHFPHCHCRHSIIQVKDIVTIGGAAIVAKRPAAKYLAVLKWQASFSLGFHQLVHTPCSVFQLKRAEKAWMHALRKQRIEELLTQCKARICVKKEDGKYLQCLMVSLQVMKLKVLSSKTADEKWHWTWLELGNWVILYLPHMSNFISAQNEVNISFLMFP